MLNIWWNKCWELTSWNRKKYLWRRSCRSQQPQLRSCSWRGRDKTKQYRNSRNVLRNARWNNTLSASSAIKVHTASLKGWSSKQFRKASGCWLKNVKSKDQWEKGSSKSSNPSKLLRSTRTSDSGFSQNPPHCLESSSGAVHGWFSLNIEPSSKPCINATKCCLFPNFRIAFWSRTIWRLPLLVQFCMVWYCRDRGMVRLVGTLAMSLCSLILKLASIN